VHVLAAVVEGGGFARAAEALGLTPSGVSRANRAARSAHRGAAPRPDDAVREPHGRRPALLRQHQSAGAGHRGRGDARRRFIRLRAGRLRVNTDASHSACCCLPISRRFLELYPELSLELIARDQLGDLVAEGFDVAVRFGEPPSSSLVARKLIDTRIVTVATPDLPGAAWTACETGRPGEPRVHPGARPGDGAALSVEFQRGRN